MPDAGGPTRSYHFLHTLACESDLTLVCLSGGKKVAPQLKTLCKETIETEISSKNPKAKREVAKLARWLAISKVILFPWLSHWHDYLHYFVQYALPQNQISHFSAGKHSISFSLKQWYNLAAGWSSMPPMTSFMYERNFQAALPHILTAHAERKFDIVWCEHSIMYPYIERIQKIVKAPVVICNSHNVETVLHERYEQMATDGWPKEYSRLQTRIFRKLETDCYGKSTLVFTCSDEDSSAARELAPGGRFSVVGNGVDTEYFTPSCSTPASDVPTVVYTGGFGYAPNQDAVRHFVLEILPLIWAVRPDCEFLFAGFEAKAMYESLGTLDSRIRYVCSPDDIRSCFDQAWVFVVPLRVGGGTRLKVLEAMAMEKAIVSTTLGAEGIPCESGKHVVHADDPADFASQVVQLLDDPTKRKQMGFEARRWVCEHYDWKILCDRIRSSLQEVLK